MSSPWLKRLVGAAAASGSGAPREILVVDDEAGIRAVVREMLVRLGWTVRSADGREAALAELSASRGAVALALVDVILPETDGMSLARELQQASPGLLIVMLSGQLNDESRWVVSENGHRFLPKPFSLEELRDVVADLLGEPGPKARG
jgi:DNA-binding response OmpR family regulator